MSWSRIRGHAQQIDAFQRAVRTHRLAHAYLFTGPSGVGKKLVAKEVAKALLCERSTPDAFNACDKCQSCVLLEAGTHPDFAVVGKPEEKHELPIAVMRELCANLALKPARGPQRVAIVDDADDFNEEAANCFLKTLEEPPEGSLLILIGTDSERQLPTIRSRCQQIVFARLEVPAMMDLLRQHGITDKSMLGRLVRLSDGSPGLRGELSAPEFWAFRQSFLEALVKPKPDSIALAKQWMTLNESAGKDSAKQRHRTGLILQLILDAYRQAIREDDDAFADPIEGKLLSELNQRFGPDGLLNRIERCLDAEMQLDRRVQLVLLVEAVVDALTQEGGVESFRPAWTV